MSEMLFTAVRAVKVLRREGLLAGVYTPESADPEHLPGGFLGAGLDNRRLAKGELFVALQGEHIDGRDFAAAALAAGHWVLTRAVDGPDALVTATSTTGVLLSEDPEAALAALAADWRGQFTLPVVGITGTNGKTTTKDLTAALLRAAGPVLATAGNLNNKLGLPLTLLGLRPEHRFAVVEMGASAVGHIAHLAGLTRPRVAVITNAGRAHLAEFGSLEGVIQGKGEILDVLPEDGRAVLNADSPGFAGWVERAPCPVVSFGSTEGDYIWSWLPGDQDGNPSLTLGDQTWPVPLPGAHNGANLAAAILVARAVGLGDQEIRQGLADFRPSEHRSGVLDIAGRVVLDDAYNANPVSMVAAAEAVANLPGTGRVLAVLGHMAELGPEAQELHQQTGVDLAARGLDLLLTVGPQARPLAEGFATAGGQAESFAGIDEAAAWLAANTTNGDRILIKGSRSAGMERLIPLLEKSLGKKENEQ
jgi:UDP-N-acetylmuramoyl-tripeptide--D-alanyl-D-alanine ligase